MRYLLVFVLMFSIALFPIAEGHLFGGETKNVGGYSITYASMPSDPAPGSDVLLAFSIVSGNVDVTDTVVRITIARDGVIVTEMPETAYPTGDIFIPFIFSEDGVYTITIEAQPRGEQEPIVVSFEQVIGQVGLQPIYKETTDVANAIALSVVFGVIPLYIGLTNSKLSYRLSNSSKGFIISIAFGIVIFSLIDLFGGASRLGIDFGLRAVPLQVTLLLALTGGLAVPFIVERYSRNTINTQQLTATYAVAYLFATAVAFHSFAEGVVVGFDLQSGYSFTFTQRSLQAASFFLHKIAEGVVISIPLMLLRPKTETFALVGIVGSVPLLIGLILAYMGIPGVGASYGFALGAGVTTYVLFKLGYLCNMLTHNRMIMFSGIVTGLLFMYLAGWIHSVEV
ncbi:MAG: hypothetical protein QXP61_03345 [Nitrososphaerales archaeon]